MPPFLKLGWNLGNQKLNTVGRFRGTLKDVMVLFIKPFWSQIWIIRQVSAHDTEVFPFIEPVLALANRSDGRDLRKVQMLLKMDDTWRHNDQLPRRLIQNSHYKLFFFSCSRCSAAAVIWKVFADVACEGQRHHVSSPTWNVSGLESRAEKSMAYFPCQLTWREGSVRPQEERELILK